MNPLARAVCPNLRREALLPLAWGRGFMRFPCGPSLPMARMWDHDGQGRRSCDWPQERSRPGRGIGPLIEGTSRQLWTSTGQQRTRTRFIDQSALQPGPPVRPVHMTRAAHPAYAQGPRPRMRRRSIRRLWQDAPPVPAILRLVIEVLPRSSRGGCACRRGVGWMLRHRRWAPLDSHMAAGVSSLCGRPAEAGSSGSSGCCSTRISFGPTAPVRPCDPYRDSLAARCHGRRLLRCRGDDPCTPCIPWTILMPC